MVKLFEKPCRADAKSPPFNLTTKKLGMVYVIVIPYLRIVYTNDILYIYTRVYIYNLQNNDCFIVIPGMINPINFQCSWGWLMHQLVVNLSKFQAWIWDKLKNMLMWFKHDNKPSPSHHHFYRWYKPFPNVGSAWVSKSTFSACSSRQGIVVRCEGHLFHAPGVRGLEGRRCLVFSGCLLIIIVMWETIYYRNIYFENSSNLF